MYQPAEFSTTLFASTIAGATTFAVASATGLPVLAAGDITVMRLDDGTGTAENVLVTAISGTTVTCAATANAHSSGQTVKGSIINIAALAQVRRDALALGPEVAITAAATATLNKMHRCAPSVADMTLTLPAGTSEGDMIGVRIVPGITKVVTLSYAGNIDGQTTRMMWAGESAYLRWDSTSSTWAKVAGKTIPMRARIGISLAATLTAATGAITLIPFNTSVLDNTGLMVNTGASNITVKRSGDYTVAFIGGLTSTTAIVTRLVLILNKNAVAINQCETGGTAATGTNPSFPLSGVETLAASDALTLSMFQASGVNQTISTSASTGAATGLGLVEFPNW